LVISGLYSLFFDFGSIIQQCIQSAEFNQHFWKIAQYFNTSQASCNNTSVGFVSLSENRIIFLQKAGNFYVEYKKLSFFQLKLTLTKVRIKKLNFVTFVMTL